MSKKFILSKSFDAPNPRVTTQRDQLRATPPGHAKHAQRRPRRKPSRDPRTRGDEKRSEKTEKKAARTQPKQKRTRQKRPQRDKPEKGPARGAEKKGHPGKREEKKPTKMQRETESGPFGRGTRDNRSPNNTQSTPERQRGSRREQHH